ncbi:Uncharacterised protein [Vibrio cholerae]|uniref:Uncharacterized protein n=1 Tax=Vibrio cholerae TaxID=666 RepID=A0A655V6G9_VIBCL|nr:Uncharacterised protein [Vibrio cholerae]CSA12931.1 Uncharacterised protein [Vibrio cholerae]CSB61846.1 Uncharacterised protein [Vibrio cholerae]
MNRTNNTDRFAIHHNRCSLTWMQRWMLSCCEAIGFAFRCQFKNRFQIALHIEEINGCRFHIPVLFTTSARDHTRQHRLLAHAIFCRRIRNEAQTVFKQTNTRLLTFLVVNHSVQQTLDQAQTHR